MLKRFCAFSAFLFLAIAAASSSLAAQQPGDSVRLTLREGPVLRGILTGRTSTEWRLAVPQAADRVVADADLRRRERQVTRSRGKLRSQSMMLGMLTGTALMIVTYQATIGAEPGDPGLGGLVVIPMAAAGAVGGAITGLAIGSFRSERVWRNIRQSNPQP